MAISAKDAAGLSIDGLKGLQAELQRVALEVEPKSQRGAMTLFIGQLHRYASAIAPVLTGRYKNSLFFEVSVTGQSVRGIMATNIVYAMPVEKRHKVFERTRTTEAPRAVSLFDESIEVAINA